MIISGIRRASASDGDLAPSMHAHPSESAADKRPEPFDSYGYPSMLPKEMQRQVFSARLICLASVRALAEAELHKSHVAGSRSALVMNLPEEASLSGEHDYGPRRSLNVAAQLVHVLEPSYYTQLPSTPSILLAALLSLQGSVDMILSGRESGTEAIEQGGELIADGEADIVIVGGTEISEITKVRGKRTQLTAEHGLAELAPGRASRTQLVFQSQELERARVQLSLFHVLPGGLNAAVILCSVREKMTSRRDFEVS